MNWIIEHTEKSKADYIMQKDAYLLEHLERPTLHLYSWARDAATYGCFTKPEAFLDLDKAKLLDLDLAKRPTGGGIVFHITDLAFSVLLPESHPKFSINTLENYAFVNEAVIETIKDMNIISNLLSFEPFALDNSCKYFCMAKPTKFDVMIDSKKIGGASQRRTKKGFLHQGTISIKPLSYDYLRQVLLKGTKVIEAMQQNSAYLLKENATKKQVEEMRQALQAGLTRSLIKR
jgi:lipoate-protein ligase A